jgi:hypothetical protein
VITEDGIKPDPEKTSCVKNFPRPHNVTTVKSFIGLANYYRRFIPKFAQIAKPMTLLLKKENKFIWNDQCELAFNTLKGKLLETYYNIQISKNRLFWQQMLLNLQ